MTDTDRRTARPHESPWRPVVRERKYRFPQHGKIVTVRAEMDLDDYARWYADLLLMWTDRAAVASIINYRIEERMRHEAERSLLPPRSP